MLIINLPLLFVHHSRYNYGYMKYIQLCADITVQTVFTSDILYSLDQLPLNIPSTPFNDVYDYILVPMATDTTPTPSKPIKDSTVLQGLPVTQCNNESNANTRDDPLLPIQSTNNNTTDIIITNDTKVYIINYYYYYRTNISVCHC